MTNIDLNALRDKVARYFDLTPFLIPQAEAEANIREGVGFRGTNVLILIAAIFIASLGLNTNSTAVIIGAMLISPLMGPIIGIGLGVGIHDFELIKRSFRNLLYATFFSVITSCVYFLISPVNEGHSELLARTSPTIYDVFIGFFGGAAGILAIGSKAKGNVLPGVAIATALMPPLCTVGYGLATWQPTYFLGALYLFFINSVFIACATTAGVKLMHYAPKSFSNPERARKVRRIVYALALLTMLPAIYLTYTMLVQNNFENNCGRFVNTEFDFPNTSVLNYKTSFNKNQRTLTVSLMGETLPQDSLMVAMTDRLALYHLNGTRLRIIQGNYYDPRTDFTQTTSSMLRDMYTVTQSTITRQQVTIDSVRNAYSTTLRNDSMSVRIAPELKVLFPQIGNIAINRTIVCDVATGGLDTMNIVLVDYDRQISAAERNKFHEFLEARLQSGNITIINSKEIATKKGVTD